MEKYLSTDSYKGVRDFYPDDMAIQQYIFDVWSQTAESFGFARYDASVLEPAELYKAKGAENEEMINEQTYTFTDRGEREVTLRPEMTPTVARMVAGKAKELAFPIRWYSIPNLFRYERAQRGRLREHWQLNCDIFGTDDYTADVEIIALAYQTFLNFGADPEMFSIRVNDRAEMTAIYIGLGITDTEQQTAITRLNDRFHKIETAAYKTSLLDITNNEEASNKIFDLVSGNVATDTNKVVTALQEMGITNVALDRSIARGFDYYTGTVFEFFDESEENNRALLGGGRYDNLTSLFSDQKISGIGFGYGDVTMRDFLETHNLLTANITAPQLMVLPVSAEQNLLAQKVAQHFRVNNYSASVDMSTRKVGKKISATGDTYVDYIIIVGEDEAQKETYVLKNLADGTEISGTLEHITEQLAA